MTVYKKNSPYKKTSPYKNPSQTSDFFPSLVYTQPWQCNVQLCLQNTTLPWLKPAFLQLLQDHQSMATGHKWALKLFTKTMASNNQLNWSPDIHLWELLHKTATVLTFTFIIMKYRCFQQCRTLPTQVFHLFLKVEE